MPNWVRTRLVFEGKSKDIKALREIVSSTCEDGTPYEFDFDKVIPTPKDLLIESGSAGDWGMRYLTLKADHPIIWKEDDRKFVETMEAKPKEYLDKCVEIGKKYLTNIAKYGYKTWYEYHYDKWGTKWSASEVNWLSDNIVFFDTAWAFPYLIVEKLSKMFPDLTIDFIYADEDCGTNTGYGCIKDGEYIDTTLPETGSQDAIETYNEVWGVVDDEFED